jgi:hypothetical protein
MSHPAKRVALLALLSGAALGIGACDKAADDGGKTATAGSAAAPKTAKVATKASAAAAASSGAATAATAAAAAGVPGDPFSGAQADPGEEVPIPYAKGYVVTAPKGWKAEGHEAGGDTVLTPPSGSGRVVLAGTASGSALELRVDQFLRDTATAGVKWEAEAKSSLGAGGLEAKVARGEGFRTVQGGEKESHKLLRVMVSTDIKDLKLDVNGKALVTIQALAEWNGDDADFEKGAIEAIKGIKKKP